MKLHSVSDIKIGQILTPKFCLIVVIPPAKKVVFNPVLYNRVERSAAHMCNL